MTIITISSMAKVSFLIIHVQRKRLYIAIYWHVLEGATSSSGLRGEALCAWGEEQQQGAFSHFYLFMLMLMVMTMMMMMTTMVLFVFRSFFKSVGEVCFRWNSCLLRNLIRQLGSGRWWRKCTEKGKNNNNNNNNNKNNNNINNKK